MKGMKKALSLILTTMLVTVSVCLPLTISAGAWEERTNEVDLRLGFLNDTHITKTGSGETGAKRALTTLKTLGMDKLAFVGDNVYYTTASDDPTTDVTGYTKLYAAVAEAGYAKEDVIAYAMGNHEFPQSNVDATVSANSIEVFEAQSGFSLNHHVVQDGFHFVVGGAKDYNGSVTAETEAYLMTEIDKALATDSSNDVDGTFPEGVIPDSTKPVFLLLHHPIGDTVNNGSNAKYTAEFVAFLAARPQIVNITAHIHRLAQHPEIIGQTAGFTSFISPMTAGGYQSQWGYTKESEINDTMCSQGSFVEVIDNVVYLYRLDYLNGTYIGEPFVINIPQIVEDHLDSDTTNDQANMPYTDAVRSTVTSTAAFPEGAAVTAEAEGTAVTVTFPNTAAMTSYDETQQDNFIRGYKIEAVSAGSVVATATFQADFWKAPENRAATYTKSLGGLAYGTEYTINVSPRTPFGAYGDPISTTVTTEEEVVDEDAVRYEIENYCPETKLNKLTEFASGGGLCISAQGGKVTGVTTLARSAYTSPFTFDIPVTIPLDGYYGIELAMGYAYNKGNVSNVSMILDKDSANIVLASNTVKGDEDRSLNNTYPWSTHMPLMHYTAADQYLTAGEHTVTVSVEAPSNTNQPYLFCADYVEFISRTPIIGLDATTIIEAEDYVDQAVVPQTDGTTYTGKTSSTARCSGGKYLFIDSVDGKASNDYLDITVPIYVETEGYYDMTSITCQLPDVSIYLDSEENELNATYTRATDTLKDSDGKYSYFNSSWAKVNIDTTSQVLLTTGNHSLIIRVYKRTDGDIAQYIDCIKFVPATELLPANGALHYEAEDYADRFKGTSAAIIGNVVEASAGQLIYRGSGSQTITPTFVFSAAEAGSYVLEFSAARGLSTITTTMDGTELTTTASGDLYKHNSHYTMRTYQATVELTTGVHELMFTVPPRSTGGLAYSFDYIRISKPVDEVITQSNATRIEFEDYTDMDKNTDARIAGVASGDAMVYNNYRTSGDPTIKAEVEIRDSGYYNIEYLVGNRSLYSTPANVATVNIYLGDKLIGTNDGTHYENLYDQCVKDDAGTITSGFWYSTSKMCRYFKDAVWLDAGVYTLEADVVSATGHVEVVQNGKVMMNYQMDYIEFRPVDGIVALGTNFVTAHINSKDALTGTVILAAYNDKELAGITTKDITDSRYANITAAITDVTHVKAFLVDDFDNVRPLVVHQEYIIGE